MNSKTLIKKLEADDWYLVRVKGSHHQFKHDSKKGLVTIKHPDSGHIKQHLQTGRLEMKIPVVLHSDDNQHYGVSVPDLAGCFSAGDSIEDALASAKEAIELHLEGLLEDGEALPTTAPISQHQHNLDYANGIWAIVEIDDVSLSTETEQIAITLPKPLIRRIDAYAYQKHLTRSNVLIEAAQKII
jgi:predicted RNase H-like HicB family nuclease/predicted RNA binding protein YcfA (HicA-like mRNA interferase family)